MVLDPWQLNTSSTGHDIAVIWCGKKLAGPQHKRNILRVIGSLGSKHQNVALSGYIVTTVTEWVH